MQKFRYFLFVFLGIQLGILIGVTLMSLPDTDQEEDCQQIEELK